MLDEGIILRSVSIHRFGVELQQFPFNVPVIQNLSQLEFASPVTYLVGENGTGKSTLLEGIAAAAGSITVGSDQIESDKSLSGVQPLARCLKLTWSKKTRKGFFMRSEDFFGYARRMAETRAELQKDLQQVERDYKDRSPTARAFARSGFINEIGAMQRAYGEDLDSRSHGESYLKLFQARFVPQGLYLLDEPEAPLSPIRQLSFLALLKGMVDQKAQFIISTHSPILMSYPGAVILSFDGGSIHPVAYEEVEHVQVTRSFLVDPQRYLNHLFSDPD